LWKIEYSRDAYRDLTKLDTIIAKRVLKKIESTRKNPRVYFKRLIGEDDYKLRVGDYRVLALLLDDSTILIQRVGHRKNIYQ